MQHLYNSLEQIWNLTWSRVSKWESYSNKIEEKWNLCISKCHGIIAWDITSKGVRGHLPLILIAPGRITRPGFVNFPFQPLSLASVMSALSCSPPSYTQQEKATISCTCKIIIRAYRKNLADNHDADCRDNETCKLAPSYLIESNLLKTQMHRNVFPTIICTAFLHSCNQSFSQC